MKAIRALIRLVVAVMAMMASTESDALCTLPLCSCSVATTNVAFASYNPLTSGNVDTVGSVVVNCGGVAGLLIPYTVDISAGAGTFTQRQMASGANRLGYNLYVDSTRTTVWGDATGGSSHVTSSILLDALGLFPGNTHTIYGRLPGLQTTAVPGTYVDTITVTLTYQ